MENRNNPRDDTSFITEIKIRPKKEVKDDPIYFSHGELPPARAVGTTFYNIDCKVIEQESGAAAKSVTTTEGCSYYIIVDSSGFAYNPVSVYAKEEDLASHYASTGRKNFEFREVSSDTFLMYLEFLKTKSLNYHREVERSITNG